MQDSDRRSFYRDADLAVAAAREENTAPSASPTCIAKTVAIGTYPTAARKFYGCDLYDLLGGEAEGSSGSLTVTSPLRRVLALNLGAAVPPVGTYVLVTFVGHRWVLRYDG